MLREIANVKQNSANLRRRWLRDDYFDIFIWQTPAGEFTSLQLCYDLPAYERVMVWRKGKGYSHHGIDSGEQVPLANRSPIMVADGVLPLETVIQEFNARSGELEPALKQFIDERLHGFAAAEI
ncbi:MAG TPA: hypothetical protein VFI62_01385 [Burkholderiales bacterium]|nr:hypothetical protein [Burkholderiales bacterium]